MRNTTNSDRFRKDRLAKFDAIPKYILPDQQKREAERINQLLNESVRHAGFVYKDVTQPFILAEWLENHQYPTIVIKRDIIDVAYAMLMNQWLYPALIIRNGTDIKKKVLMGLMNAQTVLDQADGIHIEYSELIQDELVLLNVLSELYPKKKIRPARYISDEFKWYREQLKKRPETSLYGELSELKEQILTNSLNILS